MLTKRGKLLKTWFLGQILWDGCDDEWNLLGELNANSSNAKMAAESEGR